MLMEEPLPKLDDIVKRLSAITLTEGMLNKNRLRYSGLGKSTDTEPDVAIVRIATTTDDSIIFCWMCGKNSTLFQDAH